jgi:hypothetical protein
MHEGRKYKLFAPTSDGFCSGCPFEVKPRSDCPRRRDGGLFCAETEKGRVRLDEVYILKEVKSCK